MAAGAGGAASAAQVTGTAAPVDGWPLLVVIIVLCVPLQAFAEEYVFRGVLLVAIGARFAGRIGAVAGPVVTTSVLFALVHPRPSVLLLAATFAGALVYAATSELTGGIEAASAAHAVWNASVLVAWVTTGADGAGSVSTTGVVAAVAVEVTVGAVLVLVVRRPWRSRRAVSPSS